jgi:hypothetical protein
MANQKLKPRLELEMFSFVCVDLTKCKSLFSLSVLYRMTNFHEKFPKHCEWSDIVGRDVKLRGELDDCASAENEIVYSQPTHLGLGSSTTKNWIGSITTEDCVSIVETTGEMRAKYQAGIRKFRAWVLTSELD